MVNNWTLLQSETVFEHPRMTLVEDEVRLPDGKTAKYLRHAKASSHSVGILAFNEKNELLIQKELSYPTGEVLYQLPGGGIEKGEDITTAANRELSEESGYKAAQCEVIGEFYVDNRRSDRKQYIVVCRELTEYTLQHDAEEFIESEWVPYEEVKEMVAKGGIVNINMLAAIALYDARSNA